MSESRESNTSSIKDEALVQRLVEEKQWFLALDAVRDALERFPKSHRLQKDEAHALLKLGAAEEATKKLERLCVPQNLEDPAFISHFNQVRKSAGIVLAEFPRQGNPTREALVAFSTLLSALGNSGERFGAVWSNDVEAIDLLCEAHKELWKESGRLEELRSCRDMYRRSFEIAGAGSACVNVATLSWVVGRLESAAGRTAVAEREEATAHEFASKGAEICTRQLIRANDAGKFHLLVNLGEALLHLNRQEEAANYYSQAAELKGLDDWDRLSATNQLRLLRRCGMSIPESIMDCMRLPQVAVFVGHMLDQPGRKSPRFLPDMEAHFRQEIDRQITEMDIRVGYCSAACGSDLIFIEAMQSREYEVNIVLPFDQDDFVKTSVGYAGRAWKHRFRRALKLAGHHVTYATGERYFGTVGLFAYANKIVQGLATLRARALGREPHLLAVYDGSLARDEGGTAHVVEHWPNKKKIRIIKMIEPSESAKAALRAHADDEHAALSLSLVAPIDPRVAAQRIVRAMLFADVVGFSKILDDKVPYYMYMFLNEVSRHLNQLDVQPLLVNTWGDAIFAVMEHALPMVEYARTLQRVVCDTDWKNLGLDCEMSIRIGLHAGPVFQGIDSITNRSNLFGSHVNRTARIEPITLPGQIYASQQFVALMATEQQKIGEPDSGWPYTCEYIGRLNLAKKFGLLPVYSIRSRRS